MARFGTGIQAGLGAINYTPYMQGALAGSQSIAQGIAALGQAAGGAINNYYAKKDEEEKKDKAVNSFIKTIEANPAAFKTYFKDGNVDKEAVRAVVDTLGFQGTIQLNAYLTEAAKQEKAEKTKSDAAKFATQLQQGGGNLPSPYRKGAETSMYSPESIQAGRGAYMEQEKTKAEIEALRSRASQFGDPSTAMKDAKVIADAELASGKITPAQYQQRFADLVSMGGRETFQPGGIFRRADGKGDPVSTVVNAKGEFFTQDVSGKRVPLNLGEYSPASRSESNFLSPESFQKLSTEMVNKQNQIESINDFLKSTEGLSRGGLERKFNSFSSKAKNLLGAPLNEQEQALGQSRAMQQRLLGAIKNEVLGPGVLTDQDAERLFAAMGGDVENLFTNIDRVRETLQQIMNEKYNLYKQDLDFYNYNASEKYTFAKTLKPVTLYTPPQSTGSGQSPISTPNRVLQLGTNSLTPVNRGGSVNLMDFIKKP